jgi:hypothetical protein
MNENLTLNKFTPTKDNRNMLDYTNGVLPPGILVESPVTLSELKECLESLGELNSMVERAKKRKLARQNEGS